MLSPCLNPWISQSVEAAACVTGCKYGAKWSSQTYIGDAFKAGAKMILNTSVERVLHSGGEVKGVKVHGPQEVYEIEAGNVILSAGGIGTPIILQKSGLTNAGGNLFVDLFVDTYGMVDDKMGNEAGMATLIDEFHSEHGFILSPVLDTPLHMFLYLPILRKSIALRRERLLGVMTKISDEDSGNVDADGTIRKTVTRSDGEKLRRGIQISTDIIAHAGSNPKSIFTTAVRGAHVGGTAGIGRVVNREQETEISRLFVSDCSILQKRQAYLQSKQS